MKKPCIYLDNSATTKPHEAVIYAMAEVYRDTFGNPSSLHSIGFAAEKKRKEAAGVIAASLCAKMKELIFTSGGTEANNLAIFGALRRNPRLGKKVITTQVEHPSVLQVFRALEQEGYEVIYLPVDHEGGLDLECLEAEVDENTALVSCMHVNNETGAVFPLEAIGAVVKTKNKNTLLHVDAVQSYGKLPVNVRRLPVDLLTASPHKLHGPRGCGFLWVREGLKLSPVLYGGGQMQGLRSGTEDVASIVGFSKAAELAAAHLEENARHMELLKNRLAEGFQRDMHDVIFHTPEKNSAPHILSVSFLGVKSEVLLHSLDRAGIYVSSGSACSSHKPGKSHVLSAMGKSAREIDSAIRFSLCAQTTPEEIDETIEKTAECVRQLRKVMR